MRFIALIPALLIALIMGFMTGMWQFATFSFVSIASGLLTSSLIKLKRKEPDLDYSDQPIWIHPSSIAIGDKLLPKTGWFFREPFDDIFFQHFSKLALERDVAEKAIALEQSHYRSSKAGALPFWAGVSEGADLEFDLARDGPHALIVGSTGAGKSEFLKLITGSMLASVKPKEMLMVLIDFKGGAALTALNTHPCAMTLLTDIDGTNHERFWLYLLGELKQREFELAKAGKSSVDQYPELPRLLVLADELPAILTSHNLAPTAMEAIAARGRSLGVHLIATSQSLSGISRSLITNLTLRFALGVTDPGDLVSLSPTVRPSTLSTSKAIAFNGIKSYPFDFPMTKSLPGLGGDKFFPDAVRGWSVGLPLVILKDRDLLALIDHPLEHRLEELRLSSFGSGSVLLVGARSSGKSSFAQLMREVSEEVVLDEPSIEELEKAMLSGSVICSVASNFVLPLSIQRKFDHIIYLRQGNLEQHMAAGLPKAQWNDKLPPGRGWYRNQTIQLVMPIPSQGKRGS
jgi:energy-coupling factor transporter ATP-binding protein EcfA2